MNKAVFVDRDGTLMIDQHYLKDPAGVVILPGVLESLVRLRERGYLLVLVTNQSGIARGLMTRRQCDLVNIELESQLDMKFDAIYVCPHAPSDNCLCRKPSPGMILEASKKLGVDLSRSWMVGDKKSDVLAGYNVGCKSVLIGDSAEEKWFCVDNFLEATNEILNT